MNDKITIIIPVYNSEKTIDRCLTSIVNQTYSNLDIILINDGSTDASLDKCKKWETFDKRVRVINKNNGGVSSARNLGLKNAQGKYVSFVDIDDYIYANMIEKLYNNLISYDAELSICGYNVIRSHNNNNHFVEEENVEVLNRKGFYKNISLYQGFCCNKLFVLEKAVKVLFDENIHYCEDLLFCCRYNEMIKKSCYSNLKLYNYVIDGSGAASQKWNEKKVTVLDAYKKILLILEKYEFIVYKYFSISYFSFLNDVVHLYKRRQYRIELKGVYKKLIESNLTLKEKFILFFKYRLFWIYNIIRVLYHKVFRR